MTAGKRRLVNDGHIKGQLVNDDHSKGQLVNDGHSKGQLVNDGHSKGQLVNDGHKFDSFWGHSPTFTALYSTFVITNLKELLAPFSLKTDSAGPV